ncbi:putative side tail fiber protein from lambdoid prophage (plasmid) [Escherichia coli O55:H7 str. RM12579]|uniref:tail fiber protein n=7 Tax=Escherichia coli TaxID=562 RepID=UPI00024C0827|nr:tail fiber protein [Escherichia coli]AEZ43580.1 putative side tail fiber protein from lambdoid prophage [Escherichia coli O55:H7 str. RM12579]
MNDVTVVTSVTYPSPESLALVADVQYHEPYLSAALNRKFRGIVDPGFYAGFLPKPGGGMNLLITSVDGDKTAGAASVDIGEFYQVTIQHRKDISLALNAGKKYAIVLKGRYLLGEDTYQVNTASHIHAAEFVARTYTDSYQLGDGELLVCTVNIPAGVSTITQEMIDTSERINRTIGIDISDSVTSTRSDVAASSLAVKKAYDLAKSKYTAQDASTTQKGLVQLSSATNSTSEVLAATPKAVKAAYDLANGKYTAQDATTTQKGIVQLSSDTNSTSETLAATPKAVKAAYDLAAGKAPSSHTHPWNQITGVPTASLTAKGITQLSSATNSTSEVLAATPKAVKAAYDLANGKYTAQDATTTQKGIVQLSSDTNSTSETLAATPKAVKAAYDLAAGKAPSSHTHPWNQITGVPTASLTAKGITQLSSATDSTSEVLAATPKAVKAAYDLANGKYTAQDATTAQKGIVQLSSATNSTSEVLAATPKAVKAAYDLANGKQAADATLTALAALATAADKLPYFTGVDRAALTALTSVGRAILGKTSIQSVLDYLGLGEGSALPVGVPVPWPSATPPAGWLKCNGAAFSSEMYPKLAKAYPINKLPDLRGEFIRGWDDGRGIDSGRSILSEQGYATEDHAHGLPSKSTVATDSSINFYFDEAWATSGNTGVIRWGNTSDAGLPAPNYGTFKTYKQSVANLGTAGLETRPRNIAFNYIVRAA